MQSLGWLVDLAKRAGASRLVINGSFVTDVLEPNDVNCVLLAGTAFSEAPAVETELQSGLPFLDIHVVNQRAFDLLVGSFFATDRRLNPKGMIEVIL